MNYFNNIMSTNERVCLYFKLFINIRKKEKKINKENKIMTDIS